MDYGAALIAVIVAWIPLSFALALLFGAFVRAGKGGDE